MPQLIVFRREFAGVPVTRTAVTAMVPEQGQGRRVAALGWISRADGEVVVSEQLVNSSADGR